MNFHRLSSIENSVPCLVVSLSQFSVDLANIPVPPPPVLNPKRKKIRIDLVDDNTMTRRISDYFTTKNSCKRTEINKVYSKKKLSRVSGIQ